MTKAIVSANSACEEVERPIKKAPKVAAVIAIGLDDDPQQHIAVDDRLFGRARLLDHDIGVALFGCQGQGRRAIGDQVQPQQLDRGQR